VATPVLIINEIDYDQLGTDANSFVEVLNIGDAPADLTNVALVFLNGLDNAEYLRVPLAPVGVLNPGQFLVVRNSSVLVPLGTPVIDRVGDFLQNGPDGVALIDTLFQNVLDALSYEAPPLTAANIQGFFFSVSLVEGSAFVVADTPDNLNSLSRTPNGTDTNNAATDWALRSPSPGFANF
jgi:hypothetical protein